ncbi:hypothetical protein PRIPAC_72997 [Pristionchus pacificus]|uniref:Autophagy-related protein 2 n=1 Tax=Pristionchus pacificus TaxID=54126 RepID=A0A2A6C0B0_PRIPA|nr:hypothetical protein PRIPAC_72997 [Pristionchus pacificus]|eukprot:PDM71549.1 hypothetical protein PRIPAC_37956 [Pristionchus pacificus]
MQFFGFNITEHLHGRWCRFIIHRYCGQFFNKHLSLDQLSIDLSKGFVKIEQVSLNAEYINEALTSLNLPLRLVDGFIGSISFRVPWTSLMAEASEVDLSDVQLTFRGMDAFKMDDKDLVSSIQSVVESIVSSMDVAQSFRQEEKDEGEKESTEEGSVHALSKVIEAVVSRFCCNIDDLILRLESNASSSIDMATAVEFKIEKLRFMDEQMKRCQQEGTSAASITSQAHGLSKLNKYINVEGVSLYTDVFSMADLPPAKDDSHLITSMSLRREHKKPVQQNENHTQSLQQAGSPLASMYMSTNLADSMQMSDVYQSIRSHASIDEYHSLAPEPAALISNPVKFAEIAGETTVVISIKNSDGNVEDSKASKYEFDVYSRGINVLVTPSQVELIKNLTGLLIPVEEPLRKKTSGGGEPMANRDFDLVNRQLDDITTSYTSVGNALGRQGNWQGAQDFNSFKSISLKDDFQQRVDADYCEQEQTAAEGDNLETAMVSVKIGTILAILTHDDPLSAEFVGERAPRDAIDLLHKNAKRFFERAAELNIFHAMSISSMRKATDALYLKDHIRLIGSTTSVSYSIESGPGSRMSTKLAVANCDISEYLTAASTMVRFLKFLLKIDYSNCAIIV